MASNYHHCCGQIARVVVANRLSTMTMKKTTKIVEMQPQLHKLPGTNADCERLFDSGNRMCHFGSSRNRAMWEDIDDGAMMTTMRTTTTRMMKMTKMKTWQLCCCHSGD